MIIYATRPRFRTAVSGEQLQVVATDDHRIAFRRGHKGFFMVNNNGDYRWEGEFYTGLPGGRYCDVIDGDISDDKNTCTDYNHNPNGNYVQVNADGRAHVSVQREPIVLAYVLDCKNHTKHVSLLEGKTFAISLASKLN